MEFDGTLSFRAIGRQAWITVQRFPAPLAAAAAVAGIRAATPLPDFPDRLFWLGGAFFWSLAAALLAEARPAGPAVGRVLAPWLVGAVAIAVAAWLGGSSLSAIHALLPAGLLTAFAAPLFVPAHAAPWIQAVARAIALAVAATLILCSGLTALVGGIDLLFDTGLLSATARPIWSVGLCLLMPWCALGLLPRPGDVDAATALPRWVVVLLDWVMAPLALAYGAMLNVYCFTLLVRLALPKGVVATLVTGFALAGGIVWGAAFAAENGGWSSRLLRRTFLPALAAPAVALLVATWMRIDQHGVTEQRYLLAMVAMLILGLAALQLTRRQVPSPPLAALAAAGALLVASLGPWGATGLSVRSQFDRLHAALERTGRIEDGVIVPEGPAISDADAVDISSRVLFLVERGATDEILDLFPVPAAIGPAPDGASDRGHAQAKQIVETMGVTFRLYAPEIGEGRVVTTEWTRRDDLTLSVAGFDHLFERHLSARDPIVEIETAEGILRLALEPDGGLIRIGRGGAPLALFDLGGALGADPVPAPSVVIDEVVGGDTRLRLVIERASVTKGPAEAFRLEDVRLILLTGRDTGP